MLKFHVNGSSPIDARNQDVATVDFRVFAQSSDRDLLRMDNPDGFFRLSMVTFLESVPVCEGLRFQHLGLTKHRVPLWETTCGKQRESHTTSEWS